MKLVEVVSQFMPMLDDARWAETELSRDDSQYTRRAYIRSMFALIEGTIWVLKQSLLKAVSEINGAQLQPGERELLSDTTYELSNNGKIREQTKYLKLTDNLKFTYAILGKYTHAKLQLGTGTVAWENFTTSISIRNRITHPKSSDDLTISDSEIEVCRAVTSWYNLLTKATIDKLFELE